MCCGTVGKGLLESFLDLLMLSATITTQSSRAAFCLAERGVCIAAMLRLEQGL